MKISSEDFNSMNDPKLAMPFEVIFNGNCKEDIFQVEDPTIPKTLRRARLCEYYAAVHEESCGLTF